MAQSANNMKTQGVHHVGLTVPDVQKTATFFVELLGYRLVGEKAEYPAAFVSDGVTTITLWQANDPATATTFDRNNVIGLHHLALSLPDTHALDTFYQRLMGHDEVTIEFPPEPQGTGSNRHMIFTIPGGIRLELIAPAS
jgi:catechol 2,3-dioxygenase-like lactoylglutathione lyase family enzyme